MRKLNGTEKQIKWANDILNSLPARNTIVDEIKNNIAEKQKRNRDTTRSQLNLDLANAMFDTIDSVTNAAWIIEERYHLNKLSIGCNIKTHLNITTDQQKSILENGWFNNESVERN